MQASAVDERDSRWERHDARYRLYTFDAGGVTSTVDIIDAALQDALWSGEVAGRSGLLWSLALVIDDTMLGRGLVWMSGMDYHDRPSSPAEWRARAEMQDRYLSTAPKPEGSPALPGGKRVIRLFCDHGAEWPLWESFTAEYNRTPDELGLSEPLGDRLHAWVSEHRDASGGGDHVAEGWRLHALLQDEVGSFAEVRPDFSL
ncbi:MULTISPECIES: hypothetical protein [unclassified Rathayibacter]|uniref:hypothetical protein n=1 Tax=unclassified Rathayibacter TaxID=2609250 RepID=UPI0006FD2892|nr:MULTISPECIES: hypothetical protein [unclassified Rathayibacter]KQQ05927.1 hypothetical protein ASF42_05150 [Rathayibacter sp. Leaf294]KQS13784.1 hypothetical protein ASG06_05160 [Rathayibacter sp. Leaf185]